MSLFYALAARLDARPDGRGECWVTCVNCGKPPKHFSFSERGASCFVCGYRSSLPGLAARLKMDTADDYQPLPPKAPPKPRLWQTDPERWVNQYTAALDRVTAWQQYRPLSLDTVQRYDLGVGVLPNCACTHRRLVYPIRSEGRVVGLRGRRVACPPDCPAAKVAQSAGSQMALFGLDGLTDGADILIVENAIDAMLAMQLWPDVTALALGGAANWRDDWTIVIAAYRPRRVVVALDNDLAGCPNFETYVREAERWKTERQCAPPYPNGYRIATRLRVEGVKAEPFRWPKGTPHKYDMGAFLSAVIERRVA